MSNKEGSSSASMANKIVRYEECCKNHGARAGKSAIDGCKEFMAMLTNPLYCDACECHINFHKKRVVEDGEASDSEQAIYENCCKNHAIRVAKFSYEDGCLEFMPSEGDDKAEDSRAKLICAACGCHRNFHKRKVGEKVVPRRSPPVYYGGGYDSDDY
ncbi:unnamed protein product [Camellia sinensis]